MNKPDWLVKGALVKFTWCVGEVIDIAVSDDRVMVLVASLKGIWRNHGAEWLEYHPGMIELAESDDVLMDIDKYRAHLQKMMDDFDTMANRWQVQLPAAKMTHAASHSIASK